MRKKMWRKTAALLMMGAVLTGCSGGTQDSPSMEETAVESQNPAAEQETGGETQLSGEPLVVGTMAKAMGLPVKYAMDQGYFEERGLEIELVTFATGAPINEAMNAGELDVAVSGMASVYNLATGNYTYIGDTMISEEGQSLYIRPDSDIAANEEKNGIIGSKETVEGMSILGPLSTSAQYNAIKYVESFGLTASDFEMISMEYPQAYQAFITGEGDGIATIPPYSFQLEDAGYVEAASVATLMGQPLTDGIYVSNSVRQEKPEDLQVLMEVYYQACQELMDDPDMRAEVAMAWYGEEGVTYSDDDMANELKAQTYTSIADMQDEGYLFGATMTNMGSFFATQGLIQEGDLPNIEKSFDTSFVEKITGKEIHKAAIN